MSLMDIFVKDITSQAKRVVIGYPSTGPNDKATGLYYSIGYYLKESVNNKRSEKHKVVAKIAAEVLAKPELHEFIGTLVEKVAQEVVAEGYTKSGLETEDIDQAKNDAKIVTTGKTTKVTVKKSTAKKATTTKPKKVAAKSAK